MHKVFAILLLLGSACQAGFSPNPDWRSKIDPKLWDLAQQPDAAVEFLIVMQQQANVSAARLANHRHRKMALDEVRKHPHTWHYLCD